MFFETPAQRLIVALDLKVSQKDPGLVVREAGNYLRRMCDALAPLEVTIKINTLARILGIRAVSIIHDHGLHCFLDLKLFDIGNTLENEAAWIQSCEPSILTVAERVKPAAFTEIARALPKTLVLPVDPLTDLTDEDFRGFGFAGRSDAVTRFFTRIWQKQLPGTICAPVDIALAPEGFRRGATFLTPAVKPAWSLGDDNSINALTPAAAIKAGATAIIVGRGITATDEPLEAAKRTLEELAGAL